MKKITAFAAALALLCMASCSSGGNVSPTENTAPQTFQSEDFQKTAYTKKSAELPEGMTALYIIAPYSGGEKLFLLGSGAKTPMFWTTDRDMTSFTELDIPDFDIGVSYNIAVANDGSIAALYVDADYGDLPEPDYDDPDFDQAVYDEAAQYNFKIAVYSPEGKLLSSVPVADLPVEPARNTSITETFTDGEHIIACIDGSVYLIGLDGTYLGEVTCGEEGTLGQAGIDSKGRLICTVKGDGTTRIHQVNTSDGTLLPAAAEYQFSGSTEELRPGTDGYSLFIRTLSTIYGIKEDGDGYGTIEPLFGTSYAGIGSTAVTGFVRRTDGLFTVTEMDWSAYRPKVRTYTPMSPEEYEKIPHITVGMYSEDYATAGQLEAFNETSDVQAELRLYNTSNEWSEDTYNRINEKLTQDALAGDLPDILISDDCGKVGNIDMTAMGVFIDLYPYIDRDKDISREDFVPALLTTLEHDGTLPMLGNKIAIDLGYIAKTKYVKNIGKWDFDAYISQLERMPELNEKWGETDETAYMRFTKNFDIYNWIDLDNATCSFDSESFIRVLRYCLGANGVEPEDRYTGLDPQSEEAQKLGLEMFVTQQREMIDDDKLLDSQGIYGMEGWLRITKGRFGGEDITVLGKPSPDGGHTYIRSAWHNYGITRFSEHPDEAFGLIKYLVSDEFYLDNVNYIGLPATWSGIDAIFGVVADHDPSMAGNDTEYRYSLGGDEWIDLGKLTQDDYDDVIGLINAAEPEPPAAARFGIENSDWYDIIQEETERCFAGECTPEECARVLQSRMEIYISERFG
ncbi:MAG: hypothetical protein J5501_03435 [Ruminococcus sp.]|nr:hypothetical protein [Ruminococcus sp.]